MILLDRIAKNRIVRKLMFNAAFKLPFGKQALAAASFRYVNPGKSFKKKPGVIRVLLSSEMDSRYSLLRTLSKYRDREVEFILMPNRVFSDLYAYRMNRHRLEGTIDNSILYKSKGVDYQKSLARLHSDLRSIMCWLKRSLDPDIFVSASLGDARWKHLCKLTMEEIGVPWMVTEREGVISKLSFNENTVSVAREFSPHADYLTTSNITHAWKWHKIGFPLEKIAVIGELKSDLWYRDDVLSEKPIEPLIDRNKKLILYFSFGDRNYINSKKLPPDRYNWQGLRREHLLGLKHILRQRDDVQIVVKGGHGGDLSDVIDDVFSEERSENKVIVLDSRYSAIDLIKCADLIIGMQSTAVIEAQFTDKPIIYAGWGEIHDSVYDDFLLPLRDGDIITCTNRKHFESEITRLLDGNFSPDRDLRKTFREKFFQHADGKVHRRVLECIVSIADKRGIPRQYQLASLQASWEYENSWYSEMTSMAAGTCEEVVEVAAMCNREQCK